EVADAEWQCQVPLEQRSLASDTRDIIPPDRVHYLAEGVHTVRHYKARVAQQVELVRALEHLRHTRTLAAGASATLGQATLDWLDAEIVATEAKLDGDTRVALELLPKLRAEYAADEYVINIRDRAVRYS